MEENRFTNLLTASISLSACGNSESDWVEQVIEDETIELTYVNWDTELASTHVVGEVLERLGYDVILTSVESPIMWQSIATGEADAMVIELRQAISNQEPIIVTGWTPHWKFIEFDLKMLDEPKIALVSQSILKPLSEKALSKTIQLLLRSWKTFTWEQEEFESVMLEINEGVSEEEAAENFVDNNPNLVKEWLDGVVEAAEESAENTGGLETIESNE